MNTMKVCPGCHKPLGEGAPDGLCPSCLMEAGLGTDAKIAPDSQGEGGRQAVAAHGPEEVARHFPHLEILELLGQGGMAAVYKARQPRLNRVVALKILTSRQEQDPAFAERFTREAQTLARLNHPNIVTLHDFGQVDGWYYLLMEYVDGVSLRQLLQSKQLAPEEALAIVPKICEALQYAHEHGVVHRDIKPENVLLTQEGRVKIADFGIAKMVGREASLPAITKAEQVIGTPHYMAPEQVEHPQQVDHRADIYSLGVVFYEMLTGELPLGKFPPPSRKVEIDVRLDEIVLHALEKEPERRYQQASEVKTDVETLGGAGAPATSAAGARAFRIPGTNLALVECRHGLNLVNWRNTTLAWVLLMLAGALALGLVAIVAGLMGIGLKPETFQKGGVVLAFVSAFALSVAVRRALLSLPAVTGTALRRRPPPPAARQGTNSLMWSDVLASACALAAIVLLLGRNVARTEPLMYSFFGVGGWCYSDKYNMLVEICFALAAVWVVMARLTKRGREQGASSDAWRYALSGAWAFVGMVLLVGRKVARTEPLMYSFFGVGGWLYPTSYNLLVGLCFGLAAAWLVMPRLAKGGRAKGVLILDDKTRAAVLGQVKAAAAGLMAIGLGFPLVVGCGAYHVSWQLPSWLVFVFVVDSLILLGSWRMRRLESYWLAVLAAIVSLVIALPVFLAWKTASVAGTIQLVVSMLCLPLAAFSIWALVTLCRPEVRGAFYEVGQKGASPPAGRPWPSLWVFAPVLLLVPAAVIDLSTQKVPHLAAQGAVMRTQDKLCAEIRRRLDEMGWKADFSVSVSPNLQHAECRVAQAQYYKGDWRGEPPRPAAVHIEREGLGLWQVRGEGAFGPLRFSVNTGEEPAMAQDTLSLEAKPAIGFGPVREVVLNDLTDSPGSEALNLNTGQVLDMPKDMGQRPQSEQVQWLKEHTPDALVGDDGNHRWGLVTFKENELKLARLPGTAWDTATEHELSEALAGAPSGIDVRQDQSGPVPWLMYILDRKARLPLTFAFQTGAGTSGLLQIIAIGPGAHPFVKLHYKVVEGADRPLPE